ncbi:MAG: DUF1549 domain-containing protein, partial [Saprospiraceae bacterium]|nr:DUF1549 domain-containing protein [Saprospiraceae bacterium]
MKNRIIAIFRKVVIFIMSICNFRSIIFLGFCISIALICSQCNYQEYQSGISITGNDPEVRLVAGDDEFTDAQLDQLNIDVRLLFAEKCYKCHNSTKHKAALILDTEEGIFEGGENGEVIIPGHSEESELVRRIKLSSRNEDAMPPEGNRLSKDEISLISLWIDQGAPWADTTLKLFREAPLELIKPSLPPTDLKWKNVIDLWVDLYFRAKKLKWPEEIDDRRFIRKLYLDLIGKLPTPEEIDAFVSDNDRNKREKVIDALLADEESYTIHWLSFWNDLLRNDYTGTGFITGGRRQITDWLYCALYDNVTYDQMIEDLINPRYESAGFIKGIQWRGVVNASQRTEIQAAQNVSQSLLGINLKCASCHNSFVNNVRLDQAYAFANVFADSSMQIYQCDKPTGRYTNTEFLYPQLGPVVADSLTDRLTLLADVMTRPKNGRIFRTLVNRYWDRLFGRGIVGTVDDMDQIPWSQELLDWLAADFIENGYDLKKLIKQIVSSEIYATTPIDLTPEEVTKPGYIFKGPVLRRISAEQFIDAFSEVIAPFYSGVQFTQRLPDGKPNWIWHREIELDRVVLPKPGERFLRRKFDLKKVPDIVSAEIMVTADSSFQLFLNNQPICIVNDCRSPQTSTIDKSSLTRKNCLAIEAKNDGLIANPAGVLLTLRIKYADSEEFIISDTNWVTTDQIPSEGWRQYNFIDTSWNKAKSYGGKGYWGYPVEFIPEKNDQSARAALVAADPFSLA